MQIAHHRQAPRFYLISSLLPLLNTQLSPSFSLSLPSHAFMEIVITICCRWNQDMSMNQFKVVALFELKATMHSLNMKRS